MPRTLFTIVSVLLLGACSAMKPYKEDPMAVDTAAKLASSYNQCVTNYAKQFAKTSETVDIILEGSNSTCGSILDQYRLAEMDITEGKYLSNTFREEQATEKADALRKNARAGVIDTLLKARAQP